MNESALERTYRNESDGDVTTSGIGPWKTIVLGIVLVLLITVTLLGNILVLVAVKREKVLQTPFNYYIVNLAITDIAVAMTAMSFFAIENVVGQWPFGNFLCGVWVFSDYGMTFASLFTLLAISIDRFWGVTWSLHYRRHNSKQKSVMVIVIVW